MSGSGTEEFVPLCSLGWRLLVQVLWRAAAVGRWGWSVAIAGLTLGHSGFAALDEPGELGFLRVVEQGRDFGVGFIADLFDLRAVGLSGFGSCIVAGLGLELVVQSLYLRGLLLEQRFHPGLLIGCEAKLAGEHA